MNNNTKLAIILVICTGLANTFIIGPAINGSPAPKPTTKQKEARIETIANKEALIITNPKGKSDKLYKTTDGSYKTFEEIYQKAQNELKSEYGK